MALFLQSGYVSATTTQCQGSLRLGAALSFSLLGPTPHVLRGSEFQEQPPAAHVLMSKDKVEFATCVSSGHRFQLELQLSTSETNSHDLLKPQR